MNCTGNCCQGRAACEHPEQCESGAGPQLGLSLLLASAALAVTGIAYVIRYFA
jgi:hypothetical protein